MAEAQHKELVFYYYDYDVRWLCVFVNTQSKKIRVMFTEYVPEIKNCK